MSKFLLDLGLDDSVQHFYQAEEPRWWCLTVSEQTHTFILDRALLIHVRVRKYLVGIEQQIIQLYGNTCFGIFGWNTNFQSLLLVSHIHLHRPKDQGDMTHRLIGRYLANCKQENLIFKIEKILIFTEIIKYNWFKSLQICIKILLTSRICKCS